MFYGFSGWQPDMNNSVMNCGRNISLQYLDKIYLILNLQINFAFKFRTEHV